MSIKRFAISVFIAFVAATAFDILLNAVLLRGAFEQAAKFWRPANELNRLVPLGWLSMLLTMAATAMLYVRMHRRGVMAGIEFGAWLSLAAAFGVAGMATLVPWPQEVLVGMAVQQSTNSLFLGLSLGFFYKDISR